MLYAQVWCAWARKIKSLPPLPEDPMTPELEKLLTKDPYEVPVKAKKGGERKNRTKSLSIREGASDTPAESGQSSSLESNTEEEDKEESKALSSKGRKRSI